MNNEKKASQDESDAHRDNEQKTSMTRREWLLGAGGAALAAGLPPLPSSAHENAAASQANTASPTLPPGLYGPSPSHLAHALESDERFHVITAGSETDYARPVAGEFKPAFFSQSEFGVIRRCVSILLGLPESAGSATKSKTGSENVTAEVAQLIDLRASSAHGVSEAARALSPQHKTLAIHYYGAEAVNRLETSEPGKICREGIAWLNEASQQKHGARFLALALPQQIELIKMMSDGEADATHPNKGTRLFHLLKNETIRGYYTSRVGLTELDDKSHTFHVVSPGCGGKPTSSS